MSSKNVGGRPQKTDEEKRSERVICRVTKSEKEAVKKRASRHGLSESELLRDLLFSSLSHSTAPLHKLLGESKNLQQYIRENENQLTSTVNTKLLKILKNIEEVIENA